MPLQNSGLVEGRGRMPLTRISSAGFGTKPAHQSSTAGQVQNSPLCAVLGTFLGTAVEGREVAPLIRAQNTFVKEPGSGRGRALCSPASIMKMFRQTEKLKGVYSKDPHSHPHLDSPVYTLLFLLDLVGTCPSVHPSVHHSYINFKFISFFMLVSDYFTSEANLVDQDVSV